MNIIHRDCDPTYAKNKELPRNSYLVSYLDDAQHPVYDIVQSGSRVEIFDYYYDNYRKVKSIDWTSGTVNPKTYGYQVKENKKKK